MGQDFAALWLGLGSALVWGGGDYCGGRAARGAPLLRVLLITQGSGLLLLLVLALAVREPLPPWASIGWGVAAGVAGTLGLGSLYRALAVGRAAVVAPTSAVLSAALPVLWGALSEGLPGLQRLAGFALALAGVALVARSGEQQAQGASGLGLALLAGCGFGVFFILVDRAGEAGTLWPLVAARATAVLFLLPLLLVAGRSAPPGWAGLPLALLAGVLDTGGNALFVLAGQLGRLDVAAVLASLYPASTVLIAWAIGHEPVTRSQTAGLLAALVAIVLIAA